VASKYEIPGSYGISALVAELNRDTLPPCMLLLLPLPLRTTLEAR
jgi:hypothetical protein